MTPVVAVIPSFNPDENIVKLTNELINAGLMDIIIIDDGSKEETKHFFKEISNKCILIEHKVNKGKGAGLKTAFKYYLGNYDLSYYKGVVTIDADGQHLPIDVEKCANELVGDVELVLGTRNFNKSSTPFKSRYGNKITTSIFKVLFKKRINDTQTGLRVISNMFLKRCLTIQGDRFEYEINMLIKAVNDNVVIKECPIETVYINSNRETHFDPFSDSWKIYKEMFKAIGREK